ncbi:MAG: DUF1385 domain-containing protein [Lachnotalea sp.]
MKISGLSSKDGIIFRGDNSYVISKINDKGNHDIKLIIESNNLKKKISVIPILKYYFGSIKSSLTSLLLLCLCLSCDFYYKGDIDLGKCFLIILLIAIVICLFQSKKFSGFHGAEHKAINSYNLYNDVSIENIKKSSRIAKNCGTNWLVMYLFISIVIFLLTGKFYTIIIFINYGVSRELFVLSDIDKKPIFSIVYRIGGLLQKNILTKEPTEEQLKLAKAAIEKLIDYEENNFNNKGFI